MRLPLGREPQICRPRATGYWSPEEVAGSQPRARGQGHGQRADPRGLGDPDAVRDRRLVDPARAPAERGGVARSGVVAGYHSVSPRGRLCVELAAWYLLDSDGTLFAWDPSAHPSSHAQNLWRASKLRHVLQCLSPSRLLFVDYDQTLSRTEAFRRDLCSR